MDTIYHAPSDYPSIGDPSALVLNKVLQFLYDNKFEDAYKAVAGEFSFTKLNLLGGSSISCGISTLLGLQVDPKGIVEKILVERSAQDKRIREAFVIFSDKEGRSLDGSVLRLGGDALCQYIRDNNLGDILEMGPRTNPNTGNLIKIWVWAPLHEDLSPKNKYMPVYGMQREIVKSAYGSGCKYTVIRGSELNKKEDVRFEDSRGAREA